MATTRTWLGGQHDFFDANAWTPTGAPVAGDTATIGLGTASAPNTATVTSATLSNIHTILDAGAGTTTPAADPTLALVNATIDATSSIEATSKVGPFVLGSHPAAENINVNGLLLNYGTISSSADFNTLNINLGNLTILGNLGGTISAGAFDALNIEGAGYSALYNNGTVSGAGTKIDVNPGVFGTGAFNLTASSGFNSNNSNPSTLEFHQGVSSGQTISLNASILALDAPMNFLGTINDAAVSAPGPYAHNSSVELVNDTITSLAFQNNVLTASDGGTVLAQLNFAPGLTAADFSFVNGITAFNGLPGGAYINIALPPGGASSTQMAQTASLSVAPAQHSA